MASLGSARDLSKGNKVESERGSHGTSSSDLCIHKHGLKHVHTHTHIHANAHTIYHTHTLNKTESIPILVSLYVQKWTLSCDLRNERNSPSCFAPPTNCFIFHMHWLGFGPAWSDSLYQMVPWSVPRHCILPHSDLPPRSFRTNGGDRLWGWKRGQRAFLWAWGLLSGYINPCLRLCVLRSEKPSSKVVHEDPDCTYVSSPGLFNVVG